MAHAGWGTAFGESVDRIRRRAVARAERHWSGFIELGAAVVPGAAVGMATRLARLVGRGDGGAADDGFDPVRYLAGTGVLVDQATADDGPVVDPRFEAAWFDRARAVEGALRGADSTDAVAALLGVEADRLTVDRCDEAPVARVDGRTVGRWESSTALAVDVAADEFLAALDRGWRARPTAARRRALDTLRLSLERCPRCGGSVAVGDDVVASRCRPVDVVAMGCRECDARLYESLFDPAPLVPG